MPRPPPPAFHFNSVLSGRTHPLPSGARVHQRVIYFLLTAQARKQRVLRACFRGCVGVPTVGPLNAVRKGATIQERERFRVSFVLPPLGMVTVCPGGGAEVDNLDLYSLTGCRVPGFFPCQPPLLLGLSSL